MAGWAVRASYFVRRKDVILRPETFRILSTKFTTHGFASCRWKFLTKHCPEFFSGEKSGKFLGEISVARQFFLGHRRPTNLGAAGEA
jgi:hypothetical protein